jgi:uncharacterized RDD family membrane protein YckC
MKPANLGIRSLAALINSALVCVLWICVIEAWGTTPDASSTSLSMIQGKVVTGVPALWVLLATAAYWVVPEWLFSITLGKLFCGLRVVCIDGKKITFSQSLQRNLLRLIDAFAFYLMGFLVAKLTPLHQRLGDLWAKTLVVKTSDFGQLSTADAPTNLARPD